MAKLLAILLLVGAWGAPPWAQSTEKCPVAGRYTVVGSNPGGGPYRGEATIAATSVGCEMTWAPPNASSGTGVFANGMLEVSFGSGSARGIVRYSLRPNGVLTGSWWMNQAPNQKGQETLSPVVGSTSAPLMTPAPRPPANAANPDHVFTFEPYDPNINVRRWHPWTHLVQYADFLEDAQDKRERSATSFSSVQLRTAIMQAHMGNFVQDAPCCWHEYSDREITAGLIFSAGTWQIFSGFVRRIYVRNPECVPVGEPVDVPPQKTSDGGVVAPKLRQQFKCTYETRTIGRNVNSADLKEEIRFALMRPKNYETKTELFSAVVDTATADSFERKPEGFVANALFVSADTLGQQILSERRQAAVERRALDAKQGCSYGDLIPGLDSISVGQGQFRLDVPLMGYTC